MRLRPARRQDGQVEVLRRQVAPEIQMRQAPAAGPAVRRRFREKGAPAVLPFRVKKRLPGARVAVVGAVEAAVRICCGSIASPPS